jgi:acyl carrier protein
VEIESRAKEIIAQSIGREPVEITRCIDFRQEFGLDDLDIVKLAMDLEDAFDIQMSDDQTHACNTLDVILDYIRELRQEAA